VASANREFVDRNDATKGILRNFMEVPFVEQSIVECHEWNRSLES
jgi:hypothetical protein